ncbi:ribonuclease HII [Spirulina subsalsa FACHB-351]|uniref:Ribonuclease HII n=1 Tax=Spirulina subsalsa FACHB-351 TaxID=234711 RepID=A0ABT3L4Z8_9CYAN|nr:ribonuclease HII [Spirulina subsalsa]MCW6036055.1 ribonuclease HII [Spirulina subsalsa FACHB-351]
MSSYFVESELPELATSYETVAGVDEVGRGALFGAVVAAAVVLSPVACLELVRAGVRDSKRLSAKRRVALAEQIYAIALDVQIGQATHQEIDQINIFQASLLAMSRAVEALNPPPSICFVDGKFPIPHLALPQQNIIKGDQKSVVIASASIVAKVWRDQQIIELAAEYPQYDLLANKGYGTPSHLVALQQYGPSPYHRLSFKPCSRNTSFS